MEITTTDGKKVDTKDLTDTSAEVHEKVVELHDLCKKYNLPMFCRVVLNNDKYCGAQTFGDEASNKLDFMLELINEYVSKLTNGTVGLFKVK